MRSLKIKPTLSDGTMNRKPFFEVRRIPRMTRDEDGDNGHFDGFEKRGREVQTYSDGNIAYEIDGWECEKSR